MTKRKERLPNFIWAKEEAERVGWALSKTDSGQYQLEGPGGGWEFFSDLEDAMRYLGISLE